VVGAEGISSEVAPRRNERRTNRPEVKYRIVDVHFIRWVGRISAAPHNIHLWRSSKGKRPRLTRIPRYGGNGSDAICYRVILVGEVAVMNGSAVPRASSSCVNEIPDSSGRYIAERCG
jgi:hypothetical protein